MKQLNRLIWIFVIFALIAPSSTFPSQAKTNEGDPQTLLAVFYWWYPLYGAHTREGGPHNVNGFVDFTLFHQQPANPVPYLRSEERPDGSENWSLLVDWYASNFERMSDAGIDVALLPMRPDLPLWIDALSAMAEGQTQARQHSGKTVQIGFMIDSIEHWFDYATQAVINTYNAVRGLDIQLFTYNDSPVFFVYRPELADAPLRTDDGWIDDLRQAFHKETGQNIYLALDDWWCNSRYGGRDLDTCAADNWWRWGGNDLSQVGRSRRAMWPRIATIRPAFWEYWGERHVDAQDGAIFRQQLQAVQQFGIEWVVIETWNFWEEGTAVDASVQYRTLFLDMLREWGTVK